MISSFHLRIVTHSMNINYPLLCLEACTKRTCTWQGVPCVDGWKASVDDKPHMKGDEPDGNCIYAVENAWHQSGMWCATNVNEDNVYTAQGWDWCACKLIF